MNNEDFQDEFLNNLDLMKCGEDSDTTSADRG